MPGESSTSQPFFEVVERGKPLGIAALVPQLLKLGVAAHAIECFERERREVFLVASNVRGDPVIVEGNKKGAGYDYIGRISAFTGLPAVLGWGGHENQWRGNYDEPGKREPLIEQLYNTTYPIETRNILAQFNVRYVIVGETERNQYTPEGLSKFDQLCGTAFKKGNTVIYACQ